MLHSLRSFVQMITSVSMVLGAFVFIPVTSLVHDLLPDDPEVRVVRVPSPQRCRVPRFTDASLEAALASGVRGRRSRAVQDQIRLWYHQERARVVPGQGPSLPDAEVWGAVDSVMSSGWPVSPRHPLTSGFGDRTHPVLGTRRFHAGVDIGVRSGTGVRAVLPGRVARASEDSVNGRYVELDHGDALSSVYCHASQLLVEDGDSVERDELVVLSGSTGRSTGPHLHFGLRIGRTWIDPLMVYRLQASARFGEPDGVVSSGP